MQTTLFPKSYTTPQVTTSAIAEIQLVYKPKRKPSTMPKIVSSLDCFRILRKLYDNDTIQYFEQFKILLLNRANRVIGTVQIATGGIAGVVVDPKIVFTAALKANASGIILSHNHPSGNLSQSASDMELTRKMKECGKVLHITILDHIIVTEDQNKYFSFADEGVL